MNMTEAIRLVVADQRQNADSEDWSDAKLVAYLRNVVVPWDSGPVMGAVRADFIPGDPTSRAVDKVLRADLDKLERSLPGVKEATRWLTGS